MRAWLIVAALLAAACDSEGLASGSDMAGIGCTALGGRCVPGFACPATETMIQHYGPSLCTTDVTREETAAECCIPPCPASLRAAFAMPCTPGAHVCEYAQGPDECGTAVCQPVGSGHTWFTYIRACPAPP